MYLKPRFDINQYTERTVMHCPTEESALIFLSLLKSFGKTWFNGRPYFASETMWKRHRENTCYNFIDGFSGKLPFYILEGYTILEFDDFSWDEDDIEESAELSCFLNSFAGGC